MKIDFIPIKVLKAKMILRHENAIISLSCIWTLLVAFLNRFVYTFLDDNFLRELGQCISKRSGYNVLCSV